MKVEYEKIYVEVILQVDLDGRFIPKSILWEDRSFDVDKILKVDNVHSTVGAGPVTRYICQIYGKEKKLFREEMLNKWFVEKAHTI